MKRLVLIDFNIPELKLALHTKVHLKVHLGGELATTPREFFLFSNLFWANSLILGSIREFGNSSIVSIIEL